VDAPMGRRIPRNIKPTRVKTLMTVSQYSTSPYRRTLRMLNRKGRRMKIDNQMTGESVVHNVIQVVATMILMGKSIA
jgi:hypothetical protein